MLNEIVQNKAESWLNSPDCKVKSVIEYIRRAGYLRLPQIEAIEIYLFLKIAGKNKPLWQLFHEGFFSTNEDLSKLNLSRSAGEFLEGSVPARALFEFFRSQAGNFSVDLSASERLIAGNLGKINF